MRGEPFDLSVCPRHHRFEVDDELFVHRVVRGPERVQDRLHHRGVEGGGRVDGVGADSPTGQARLGRGHVGRRTGDREQCGELQRLERDALNASADAARREELVRHLDHIEKAVVKIDVPPAFGDLFYGLRGHIAAVRESLLADTRGP